MNQLRTITLVTACLVAATGCKAQEPSESDYDDVATAVGALVVNDSGGELGSMADADALAAGDDSGLTAEADGSFQGKYAGLTYSYQVTCKDSEGDALAACGGNTESAQLVVNWTGNLDLPRYQATVTRTGDWTLSGLQSDTALFNGHGTFDIDTEFQGFNATRIYQLDYDGDYQDVSWDRATKKALGGTILYTVHAQRKTDRKSGADVEVELDVEVKITFDGSGTATIVVDGSRNYSLDLASGQVSKN